MRPVKRKRVRFFNRMGVFATLMFSYVMVLLLPVGIALGLYNQIETIMMDNATSANKALIEQVKQVVDSRLEEMGQLSRHIYTHPQLPSLLRQERPLSGAESYAFVAFKKELERYRNVNTFIHDFYVYFKESDTVLTPTMSTNSGLFYSDIYGYANMSYDTWRGEVLERRHAGYYLPADRLAGGYTEERVLSYVQSLPAGERDDPSGALVILIREGQIQQMMAEIIKVNNGSLFIKDAQGQVLMSSGDARSAVTEDMAHEAGMITVSAVSAQSGWEYVSVVPAEVFWEKVNLVKVKALQMLLICLIAGGVVCSLMSYRAYRPIKEIIASIGSRRPEAERQYLDEYDYIKSSVMHSFDKQVELEGQLVKQTPVIRSNFLSRLLKGHIDPEELDADTLAFMGIHFEHPLFGILMIRLTDASGFMRDDTESEWALVRFVVGKVAEEMTTTVSYSVEMDKDRIAVILNLPKTTTKEQYYAWAEDLMQVIGTRFKTVTSVGVSELHSGLAAIGTGYQESLKALDYSIFSRTTGPLLYEQVKRTSGIVYDFPLETEVQLINATKSGNAAKAVEVIGELYRNNFESRQTTPELGKLLFSNLLSTLFKLLNTLGLDYETVFGDSQAPLARTLEAGTVEELHREVVSLYEQVCRHVSDQREDPATVMLERMQQFIRQHYTDPMLSLVSIAEHFHITPQYLSSFFKKQAGINLTDYLAQIRLAHAKRLLEGQEHTITAIAAEVGYASNIGFIRMFKKYEGITPGKYKELHRS
ncbi:helix-turn-helix domain-containing protein [Paenibacillus sp. 1P07SE]|uniref:helix-turn-helix domain-containing protein n=1 Tax=Paenibacillus sp. 1P07SE TaxID=3132209 RepID=UPI0039A696AA